MPIILGDDGSNTLAGSAADDTLLGLGGDDTLIGNGGQDSIDGGAGFDTADFAGIDGDINVNLADGVERGVTNSVFVSIEAVAGGDGSDAITGDANANWLEGRAGDDVLYGAGGSDTLVGGTGSNLLDGGDGQDILRYDWATGAVLVNLADHLGEAHDPLDSTVIVAEDLVLNVEHVIGGAGDDTLIGDDGWNYLLGGGGDDSVSGGAGNDTLVAGQGEDTLDGGAGFDTADFSSSTANLHVNLTAGRETLDTKSILVNIEAAIGGSGDDVLTGEASGNWLDGRAGDDTIRGNDGNDTLVGGLGDNRLDGGTGDDVADYSWSNTGIHADIAAGTVAHQGGTDVLLNIEHIVGSALGDTIAGSAAANFIQGGDGNDSITAGAGNDTIAAGEGADTIDGGDGIDFVDFASAASGMALHLATGTEDTTGSVVTSIEGVLGSTLSDLFDGDANANWIDGRAGDDTIHGFDSQDTLIGGLGSNVLDGGDGSDVVRYDWMDAPVLVDLGAGTATGAGVHDTLASIEAVIGTLASDTITGGDENGYFFGGLGDDVVSGGAGDDTIAAGAGHDTVDGGAGFDLVDFGGVQSAVSVDLAAGTESTTGTSLASIEAVIGTNGDDAIRGGTGNDWLSGGAGADTLEGGLGNDSLLGGAGADRFALHQGDGFDVIFGFETGVDVIDEAGRADAGTAPNIFQDGSNLVIAFGNGDTLYLVGTSFATFNAGTDLLV